MKINKGQKCVKLENGISLDTLISDSYDGEEFLTYVAEGDACYSTIIAVGPYGGHLYPEIVDQLSKIFSVPHPYPCKKCTLLNQSISVLNRGELRV